MKKDRFRDGGFLRERLMLSTWSNHQPMKHLQSDDPTVATGTKAYPIPQVGFLDFDHFYF